MPPGRNVGRALHTGIARLFYYAGLCVEGSLVTWCDGFYLFACVEEVNALEVPNASPTRYAAAEHKSQQLSSRVSCLLVCFLKRLALPSNMEDLSRTIHLTSGIIAHFTECSEHICTNFWGLYKNWC